MIFFYFIMCIWGGDCACTHTTEHTWRSEELAWFILFHCVGQNTKLEAGCILIYAAEDQTHGLEYTSGKQALYTEPYPGITHKIC